MDADHAEHDGHHYALNAADRRVTITLPYLLHIPVFLSQRSRSWEHFTLQHIMQELFARLSPTPVCFDGKPCSAKSTDRFNQFGKYMTASLSKL